MHICIHQPVLCTALSLPLFSRFKVILQVIFLFFLSLSLFIPSAFLLHYPLLLQLEHSQLCFLYRCLLKKKLLFNFMCKVYTTEVFCCCFYEVNKICSKCVSLSLLKIRITSFIKMSTKQLIL